LQGYKLEGEANDIVSWALEPKKLFSTKSLYRFLTDRGMPSRVACLIWKCKIPLKIKFFLWQVFHNKLQVFPLASISQQITGDREPCEGRVERRFGLLLMWEY
jgi:hypothetical protein